MKRKCIHFVIVLVMLFQAFTPSFLFAASKDTSKVQPPVCLGPSEMMSQYFNFQREIRAALSDKVDEERFYTSTGRGWLFTHGVLELPSALDFVASNLWGSTKSNISTAVTSMVLLLMASASVFQSNTEGLAILFKDRPVVRDYKTILDIETDLFDTAYFYSKQVNLVVNMEGKDVYANLNGVIENYRKSGLLADTGKFIPENSCSMSDILQELISMNTVMKHFILYPGPKALRNYNGCFGQDGSNTCDENNAILRFNDEAIVELDEEYSKLSVFGSCSVYASNFLNSINKSVLKSDSVKQSFKDVEAAMKRLGTLFTGKSSKGTNGTKKGRCDLSDYEMAQMRAYRGPGWTCKEGLVDMQSNIKDLFGNKKVKKNLSEKTTNLTDNTVPKNEDEEELNSNSRSKDWYSWFGEYSQYNPSFSENLYNELVISNQIIQADYKQSQNNAESSDMSLELSKIKGLLDAVTASITTSKQLEKHLKSISDYQCAY